MNYFKVIGLLAATVVVFGYFLIFYVPASESVKAVDQATGEIPQNQEPKLKVKEPFTGNGTMSSLRLLGEDLECSITYKSTEGDKGVEGTYFVSDGNIRGDFMVPSPDLEGTILSSMIMDETYFYSWTEIGGQTYGAKILLTKMNNSENKPSGPVSIDSEVNYSCKPWENVDGSVFLPPSTVLFRDMNETMKAGMEYGTTYEEGAELPR